MDVRISKTKTTNDQLVFFGCQGLQQTLHELRSQLPAACGLFGVRGIGGGTSMLSPVSYAATSMTTGRSVRTGKDRIDAKLWLGK